MVTGLYAGRTLTKFENKNFFLNPNISSDLHIHFISLLYNVFEYFLLWRHSAKSPFPSPNSSSYPYLRAYFSFIKALISSNTWIFGKVSSFAQEAPAVASVPWRRSLYDIIEDFWERVPFGVDVWGGNWEIHWFFSFLVGENNMVSLTPALKLSEA